MENEYLCFIKYIGQDLDDNNIYDFLFTDDIDNFWGENFEYKPAGLCNELIPDKNTYNIVKTLKTNIKLDLAQESTCLGYQDCIDSIIAVAWENLDNYEEYPEPIRLVFHYGDNLEDVEIQLSKRNLLLEEKNNGEE